ncbi:MAG: alpha-L-fucosidase [Bacteroidaceae bacterium]|nr:alpha-L-fucosidase [Bacteroidaceae bacterium]
MKRIVFSFLYFFFFSLFIAAQKNAPEPIGPLPSPQQVEWQKMETYAFIHYGLNTFTDKEWGYGDADPKTFNPSRMDVEQWVRTFKQAGMKGVIIVAKHHDGFAMWPSPLTEYNITKSSYDGPKNKDGKVDVLAELRKACDKYGLKMGIYLSPWDRNHAEYGRQAYVDYYHKQLEQLTTEYGPLFEVWLDGANGGDGYYGGARETRKIDRRNYYNFPKIHSIIQTNQPQAIIFSDGGPGCRWVGNERGEAGIPNWSFLKKDEVYPGMPNSEVLGSGFPDGDIWVAAECDVSIRPGWFYHPEEDSKVKTPEQLVDIYYKSVGRNATFLLNFPVDREGRVNAIDSTNAVRFRQIIDAEFKTNLLRKAKVTASSERGKSFRAKKLNDGKWDTYWSTPDGTTTGSVTFTFRKPTRVNRLLLQEYIPLGQRVKSFAAEALVDGKWTQIDPGESFGNIGYKRILRFPTIQASALRINILDSRGPVCISGIEAYCAPE